MRVLVGCERSGIVRDAFRKRGHDAWSCDILPVGKGAYHHYNCDLREILDFRWDLAIFHPPCTFLSKAGARWLYQGGEINKERLELGMKAKEFLMELLNADIPRIALENPTPLKIFELPPHTQVIQPYQFGHPYSKRTLLWLKNLPELKPTGVLDDYKPYLPSNTGGKKRGQKSVTQGVVRDKTLASKTFQGIAEAMAGQWGSLR